MGQSSSNFADLEETHSSFLQCRIPSYEISRNGVAYFRIELAYIPNPPGSFRDSAGLTEEDPEDITQPRHSASVDSTDGRGAGVGGSAGVGGGRCAGVQVSAGEDAPAEVQVSAGEDAPAVASSGANSTGLLPESSVEGRSSSPMIASTSALGAQEAVSAGEDAPAVASSGANTNNRSHRADRRADNPPSCLRGVTESCLPVAVALSATAAGLTPRRISSFGEEPHPRAAFPFSTTSSSRRSNGALSRESLARAPLLHSSPTPGLFPHATRRWVVFHRFREFAELHEKLLTRYLQSGGQKKMFPSASRQDFMQ